MTISHFGVFSRVLSDLWRILKFLQCSYILVFHLQAGKMPQIEYSEKYYDDTYEYRHVELPPEVARLLPKNRLLTENEWRGIGVQQSRGWVHYAIHRPEPHIMLFRRPLNYQQQQAQQHPAQAMGLQA